MMIIYLRIFLSGFMNKKKIYFQPVSIAQPLDHRNRPKVYFFFSTNVFKKPSLVPRSMVPRPWRPQAGGPSAPRVREG